MKALPLAIAALSLAAAVAVLFTGCGRKESPDTETPGTAERAAAGTAFTADELREILKLSPLPPPPPSPTNAFADNPAAARLGQRLFFDTRLSANGKVSCATCHDPTHGFSDPKPLSAGIGATERHSMPLWNVAQQHWFFWDGRADSLWAQAVQPLLHPAEMGASAEHLRAVLAGDADLKLEFESLFGALPAEAPERSPAADRLLAGFGKVLEAYERRIVGAGAPFDQFVEALRNRKVPEGAAVLSEPAQRGLQLFIGRGRCVLCHSGPNFSDGEFHNTAPPKRSADQGRFNGILEVRDDRFNGLGPFSDDRGAAANVKLRFLALKQNHLGEFKTPSLRNVSQTAPYMHDGGMATLREVLDFYSELPGLPILGHREETLVPGNFTTQEKADIEAFLLTLTGRPPDAAIMHPPSR